MCPGDTVVFTCVTDTIQLSWSTDDGKTSTYFLPSQVNEPAVNLSGGVFVLKLVKTSNNTFISTATAHNVSLNNDGINITCISDINNPDAQNTDSIDIGLYYASP